MMNKKDTTKKMKDVKNKISVYDLNGKVVGDIQLDESVFNGEVNHALLFEVNKMYEARMRKGTASTKTRAEVSGGGIKPWRQKGTGRARVGSTRNPLWRHGGNAFGPKPRDFKYTMPQKAMTKALISILNARLMEEGIKAIVAIELKEPKTKEIKKIIDNLAIKGKTLLVVNEASKDVKKASGNMKDLTMKESRNINARDVLLNQWILIEKEALEKLAERVK